MALVLKKTDPCSTKVALSDGTFARICAAGEEMVVVQFVEDGKVHEVTFGTDGRPRNALFQRDLVNLDSPAPERVRRASKRAGRLLTSEEAIEAGGLCETLDAVRRLNQTISCGQNSNVIMRAEDDEGVLHDDIRLPWKLGPVVTKAIEAAICRRLVELGVQVTSDSGSVEAAQ